MDLKADIKNRNTVWHHATVNRERRQLQNQHKSVVLWFTGLSGAGKSTLAHAIEEELYQKQCRTYVPDGDNVRHGLCSDLGFSDKDREENIRKIGNVAKLFLDSGVIVLTAFISPFQKNRAIVRSLMQASDFLEIYCSVSIDVCEQRDIKGLYKKAREGLIPNFTGVSSKYEAPTTSPELNLNTSEQSLEEYTQSVVQLLTNRGIINNYSN